MALSIFDFIGRIISTAMYLMGSAFNIVLKAISAVSDIVFTPLTLASDRVWAMLVKAGPRALVTVLGGAALVLLLLAAAGWVISAYERRNRR